MNSAQCHWILDTWSNWYWTLPSLTVLPSLTFSYSLISDSSICGSVPTKIIQSLTQSEMLQKLIKYFCHYMFRFLSLWSPTATSSSVNLLKWASQRAWEIAMFKTGWNLSWIKLILLSPFSKCRNEKLHETQVNCTRLDASFSYIFMTFTIYQNRDTAIDKLIVIFRYEMCSFL